MLEGDAVKELIGKRVRRTNEINPRRAAMVGVVERVWLPRYGGHFFKRVGDPMARVRFGDRTE